MTTKKPNFIVKFDNSNPAEEERAKAICDLTLCLIKLSAKQEAKKFKTKKEQKTYEQNFSDFASKSLCDNSLDDKNNKIMFELLNLSLLLSFAD